MHTKGKMTHADDFEKIVSHRRVGEVSHSIVSAAQWPHCMTGGDVELQTKQTNGFSLVGKGEGKSKELTGHSDVEHLCHSLYQSTRCYV